MKKGRKREKAFEKHDRNERYKLTQACELLKEASFAKFDESVDLAVRLGVDPKHADQQVRGAIVLPHGTGKTVRVLVFAKGEKASEAEAAGADFVGADDLAEKISGGWLEFDTVIASPDMMGTVGKLGRVLGPRGLMPNPKTGTVTIDVAKAVKDAKGGKVQFRVEQKGAIVHAPVGKASFEANKLEDNARALLNALIKAKPASAKGIYLRSITLSSTMGPGFRIDPNTIQASEA